MYIIIIIIITSVIIEYLNSPHFHFKQYVYWPGYSGDINKEYVSRSRSLIITPLETFYLCLFDESTLTQNIFLERLLHIYKHICVCMCECVSVCVRVSLC